MPADRAPCTRPAGVCSFILPFSKYLWTCSALGTGLGSGATAGKVVPTGSGPVGAGAPVGTWTVDGKCACVICCRERVLCREMKQEKGL